MYFCPTSCMQISRYTHTLLLSTAHTVQCIAKHYLLCSSHSRLAAGPQRSPCCVWYSTIIELCCLSTAESGLCPSWPMSQLLGASVCPGAGRTSSLAAPLLPMVTRSPNKRSMSLVEGWGWGGVLNGGSR